MRPAFLGVSACLGAAALLFMAVQLLSNDPVENLSKASNFRTLRAGTLASPPVDAEDQEDPLTAGYDDDEEQRNLPDEEQKNLPVPKSVPALMHTIWMCNPFRPFFLTALDSAVHYMPGMLIKLHIIVPDGATAEDIAGFRETFEWQLEPLTSRPEAQIELVIHDDIAAELVGSPLDGLGITQAHMGGTMEILRANQADQEGSGKDRSGSSHGGHHSMSHATDLLRMLLLWREGGVYFDADVLFLRDIRPVIDESGPFSVCQSEIRENGDCWMTSFFSATPKGHPFLELLIKYARTAIAFWSPDRVFPYTKDLAETELHREKPDKVSWTVLADGFDSVWTMFLKKGKHVVDELKEKRRGGLGMTYELDGSTWTAFGLEYWSLHNWDKDTLRKPPTAEALRDRLKGYILHLWEKSKLKSANVRARYVENLREDTLMAAIHDVICLAYCDPDALERSANRVTNGGGNAQELPAGDIRHATALDQKKNMEGVERHKNVVRDTETTLQRKVALGVSS